jgi:hypothetical protein
MRFFGRCCHRPVRVLQDFQGHWSRCGDRKSEPIITPLLAEARMRCPSRYLRQRNFTKTLRGICSPIGGAYSV